MPGARMACVREFEAPAWKRQWRAVRVGRWVAEEAWVAWGSSWDARAQAGTRAVGVGRAWVEDGRGGGAFRASSHATPALASPTSPLHCAREAVKGVKMEAVGAAAAPEGAAGALLGEEEEEEEEEAALLLLLPL